MNRILAALPLLLVGVLAFGQVDRDELSKGQGTSVTFTNYVGPHNRIDTVEQIVGIGQGLGRGVTAAPGQFTSPASTGSSTRSALQRATSWMPTSSSSKRAPRWTMWPISSAW